MKTIVTLLFAMLCGLAFGQELLPEAPQHKFLTRETVIELSTSAVSLSTDALASLKCSGYRSFGCNELNPLAKPFVNSRLGAGIYFGSAFAVETGLSYFASKHPFLKWPSRIGRILFSASELYWTERTYRATAQFSQENNCVHRYITAGKNPPPGPCH